MAGEVPGVGAGPSAGEHPGGGGGNDTGGGAGGGTGGTGGAGEDLEGIAVGPSNFTPLVNRLDPSPLMTQAGGTIFADTRQAFAAGSAMSTMANYQYTDEGLLKGQVAIMLASVNGGKVSDHETIPKRGSGQSFRRTRNTSLGSRHGVLRHGIGGIRGVDDTGGCP